MSTAQAAKITTTDAAETALQFELPVPDFPEDKGRTAYELMRVVVSYDATAVDDTDPTKDVPFSYHVRLPNISGFPQTEGEFWGGNLAEIAWNVGSRDRRLVRDQPLPLEEAQEAFDEICAAFIQKVTQRKSRQWLTELVEQATASCEEGCAL